MNPARIAVITPYHKEPIEMLRECHESVLAQGVDAHHYFIADGHPQSDMMVNDKVSHVMLPNEHADYGNTPRGIGGILAVNADFDYITYLDADNWYHPNHLTSLIDLHKKTGADICCSFRTFHQSDRSAILVDDPQEQALRHVDTNCYFLSKSAFEVASLWTRIPKQLAPVGDRVFKEYLKQKRYRLSFSKQKTVAYRTLWRDHYVAAGLKPPLNSKNLDTSFIGWLKTAQGVKECVEKLGFYPV